MGKLYKNVCYCDIAPTINILITYGALQVFILYCIVLYITFEDWMNIFLI